MKGLPRRHRFTSPFPPGPLLAGLLLLLLLIPPGANAAGHLRIEQPWIRTAPPGAAMLAGYAVLRNDGDGPLVVTAGHSASFADVSIHQSTIEDGVARMHALPELRIAPGTTVELAPGGIHLMLMEATGPIAEGTSVVLRLHLGNGDEVAAPFPVRADPPAP